MDLDVAAELGRQTLFVAILLALPSMLSGMVVGLLISLVQSITSIQEQTLSFVPKILVTLAVTVFALPWSANHLVEFTREIYSTIPTRF